MLKTCVCVFNVHTRHKLEGDRWTRVLNHYEQQIKANQS